MQEHKKGEDEVVVVKVCLVEEQLKDDVGKVVEELIDVVGEASTIGPAYVEEERVVEVLEV